MTDPRPWPNNAREDRDAAAERFAAIIKNARTLRKIVMRGHTREEVLYMVSLIVDDASTGIRHLERHGASTIPMSREENGE